MGQASGTCTCVCRCPTGARVRRAAHAPAGFLSQEVAMGTSAPWMASSSQINNQMTQRLKAQKISCLHWPRALPAANLEPLEPSPALCFPPPSVSSSRTHELTVPGLLGTTYMKRLDILLPKKTQRLGQQPGLPPTGWFSHTTHPKVLSLPGVC